MVRADQRVQEAINEQHAAAAADLVAVRPDQRHRSRFQQQVSRSTDGGGEGQADSTQTDDHVQFTVAAGRPVAAGGPARQAARQDDDPAGNELPARVNINTAPREVLLDPARA